MENHPYLIELLDDFEASEYGTPEYSKIDHRIGAYYQQRMLFNDMTIPNKVLLRTFWIGIRKQGILQTIRQIPTIIRLIYQTIKES
jgi:ABC-type transporter Mla maintaining outer membrane lipid asymmetry ATPase subunit MlaF